MDLLYVEILSKFATVDNVNLDHMYRILESIFNLNISSHICICRSGDIYFDCF